MSCYQSSLLKALLLSASLLSPVIAADTPSGDPAHEQKKFAMAPIVSSSPTLGTGLGVTGSYLYKLGEGNPTSQLMGMAQYTNNDSYMAGARNMAFWDGGKRRAMTGLMMLHINNDFDNAQFVSETLGVFHRQSWLVAENWFVGLHGVAMWNQYDAENALGERFLSYNQAEDNNVYGLGVNLTYDTRDNVYYPFAGSLFELNTYSYLEAIGSDVDYDSVEVKWSHYIPVRKQDVLALGFYGRYTSSNAPYSGESYLGRRSFLRGFNAGEVSGTHLSGFQAEYRYFLSERWKLATFGGLASISGGNADKLGNDGLYYSAGVGVRYAIQPQDRIHFRIDVAAGNDDNQGFYVGLQEAF